MGKDARKTSLSSNSTKIERGLGRRPAPVLTEVVALTFGAGLIIGAQDQAEAELGWAVRLVGHRLSERPNVCWRYPTPVPLACLPKTTKCVSA